jgi:hypothetical protein
VLEKDAEDSWTHCMKNEKVLHRVVRATHMHQSLRFPQQHREGERGTHAAAASPFSATACSKVIQPTPPTGHGIGAQQVSPASQSQNRLSRVQQNK